MIKREKKKKRHKTSRTRAPSKKIRIGTLVYDSDGPGMIVDICDNDDSIVSGDIWYVFQPGLNGEIVSLSKVFILNHMEIIVY